MSISETVKTYLNQSSRINVLSTSTKDGETNVAMFGSPVLTDDAKVMMVMSDNRSYANLRQNPRASLLVVVPGKTGMQTEGCRLYLKVNTMEDSGPRLDKMKSEIMSRIGDAAKILTHLVVFDVMDTRPIVDMGQGI